MREGLLIGPQDRALIETTLIELLRRTLAPLVFCGYATSDGRLRIESVEGSSTGALAAVSVAFGAGVGGLAASTRRVHIVSHYVRALRISHEHDSVIPAERIRAMIAAPVVIEGATIAVIYCVNRTGAPLSERVIRATTDLVRDIEHRIAVRRAVEEYLDSREGQLHSRAMTRR